MNRIRVKICGVTTPEDARLAAECGADAIGINFYEKSPRFVDPRQAGALVRGLPPLLDTVGVFVGLKTRQVCAIAYQLGLHSVQYLADPSDTEDSFPFRRIAAFRIKDRDSLAEIERYLSAAAARRTLPAAVLVDAHVEGQFGGTGQKAPWELLAGFRPSVPLILAGGLTPENVAEAIAVVKPYAVDVASGVEASPGKKDPAKVQRFIDAVRGASPPNLEREDQR